MAKHKGFRESSRTPQENVVDLLPTRREEEEEEGDVSEACERETVLYSSPSASEGEESNKNKKKQLSICGLQRVDPSIAARSLVVSSKKPNKKSATALAKSSGVSKRKSPPRKRAPPAAKGASMKSCDPVQCETALSFVRKMLDEEQQQSVNGVVCLFFSSK